MFFAGPIGKGLIKLASFAGKHSATVASMGAKTLRNGKVTNWVVKTLAAFAMKRRF